MELRDYQADGADAIWSYILKNTEPCLLEAVTAAGKTFIIAELAKRIWKASKKSILCIAPNKELVEQNYEKYLLTGEPASIYSASVGRKCLRHPVIFGTPLSIKNGINKIGSKAIAAVIIDEAHNLTDSIKFTVDEIKKNNPNCRVIGLTGTPYRTVEGFIYAEDDQGSMMGSDLAFEPYFRKLVYRITGYDLLERGFISPVKVGIIDDHYDTSKLIMSNGRFLQKSLEETFVGKGRLTSKIIQDIVAKSWNRRGVIIYCATRDHALEALSSLPKDISKLVTGETIKSEREKIVRDYKAQKLKYLVNVGVYTTGFDAPHTDVIALLRHTESASLLTQIIGRGFRLFPGKDNFLLLDYAENIDKHFPDGDLFAPAVRSKRSKKSEFEILSVCPECGYENLFAAVKNKDGLKVDENGYFLDLEGNRILGEYGHIPAHYGRRCNGYISSAKSVTQCGYRWTFKECPNCNHENDITARRCEKCRTELVNPNDKLKLEFKKFKKDAFQLQTDEVIVANASFHVSTNGNECLKVVWHTPYRSVTTYHNPSYNREWTKLFSNYSIEKIIDLINEKPPKTISYRKESSGFYKIYGFNEQADEVPK